jgi:hypothetical protein
VVCISLGDPCSEACVIPEVCNHEQEFLNKAILKSKSYAPLLALRMALRKEILSIFALVVCLSIHVSSVNAQVDYFIDEYYDLPKERLPFRLLINSTTDGLEADEVSQMQITLYENLNNEKITNVTYFVTIADLENNELLLRDVFYCQNGTVNFLLVHNSENRTVIMNGYQEQFLNAWGADASGKPDLIVIASPQMQKGGMYQLTFELLTVDDVRNIISPEDMPKLEYVLDTDKHNLAEFTIIPEFPMAILPLMIGIVTAISFSIFVKQLAPAN